MPFWTNTSAIMIIDGKEITMTAVEDYCGWFEAKTDKKDANFTVRFKQTIGNIYVGGEGSEEVATGALPVTEELSLDSVAALGNTIWVRGYENDAPEVTSEYPNVLGDCPLRNISVMMFDWLHGSKKDGTFSVRTRNGVEDTTFNNGAKELDPEVGLGSPYAVGFAISNLWLPGKTPRATSTPTPLAATSPFLWMTKAFGLPRFPRTAFLRATRSTGAACSSWTISNSWMKVGLSRTPSTTICRVVATTEGTTSALP